MIRAESDAVLQHLYDGLEASPDAAIVIEGHTSNEGSEACNPALSERRARSVVEKLVEYGISADRISAVGHGESKPIASNGDETGRSLNRHVAVSCAE